MTLQPSAVASVHLDLVRGLAAVVVLVSHLRILFLVDYAEVERPGTLVTAVYTATGFFHQAVLGFFVLSGFFIASSVARQLSAWSWRRYATDRAVRLYLVLVPALALTAACDGCGSEWGRDPSRYRSELSAGDGFYRPVDSSGAASLLGNLVFLQTITTPPFGSNSPLWSLANEFWYYALFPFALFALTGRRNLPTRLSYVALVSGLLALLPAVRPLFPVWLFGAAVRWLPSIRFLACRRALAVASVGTVVVTVCARFAPSSLWWDYSVGLLFAGWVYVLLHGTAGTIPGWYRRLARNSAGCSFTLYAVHMPLLTLVAAVTGWGRSQPTVTTFAWLSVLGMGVFVIAWLLARLTEYHTDRVRRWVLPRVRLPYPATS